MKPASLPAPPQVSPSWALFLDVDGTLVDLADTPDKAAPRPELLPVLKNVRDLLGGALALVSGRPLSGVDRLAPLCGPAAGMHGLEHRRADGVMMDIAPPTPALRDLADDLRTFEARHPGIICEDKGPTVTLHYRMAPELESAARDLIYAHRLKLEPEYKLQEGKMMIEIKPVAATKGQAVDLFMQEPPFIGRQPVFVGDDLTDEDGFAAVNRLGGLSVWVSDAPESRETAAQFHLGGVDDVIAWLDQLS